MPMSKSKSAGLSQSLCSSASSPHMEALSLVWMGCCEAAAYGVASQSAALESVLTNKLSSSSSSSPSLHDELVMSRSASEI